MLKDLNENRNAMIKHMEDYQQRIEYLEQKSKISEVKIHWVTLAEYWRLKNKRLANLRRDQRILPNLKNTEGKKKIKNK